MHICKNKNLRWKICISENMQIYTSKKAYKLRTMSPILLYSTLRCPIPFLHFTIIVHYTTLDYTLYTRLHYVYRRSPITTWTFTIKNTLPLSLSKIRSNKNLSISKRFPKILIRSKRKGRIFHIDTMYHIISKKKKLCVQVQVSTSAT